MLFIHSSYIVQDRNKKNDEDEQRYDGIDIDALDGVRVLFDVFQHVFICFECQG